MESELNYEGGADDRRKRVTIAEATLSGAPLQCWDNSTRGLDSANAVQFCKTLRTAAEFFGTTSVVAIYQAPQSAYEQFDKVRPHPCMQLMSGIGIVSRRTDFLWTYHRCKGVFRQYGILMSSSTNHSRLSHFPHVRF